MSDGLIERLEKAKSDLAPYDRESVAKSIHLNTISIDAILSALKTVRGIEGLAKESESGVSITVYQNGADVRAQRKKHGYLNKNKPAVRASNLSLAVDAAMVANEKGVK